MSIQLEGPLTHWWWFIHSDPRGCSFSFLRRWFYPLIRFSQASRPLASSVTSPSLSSLFNLLPFRSSVYGRRILWVLLFVQSKQISRLSLCLASLTHIYDVGCSVSLNIVIFARSLRRNVLLVLVFVLTEWVHVVLTHSSSVYSGSGNLKYSASPLLLSCVAKLNRARIIPFAEWCYLLGPWDRWRKLHLLSHLSRIARRLMLPSFWYNA